LWKIKTRILDTLNTVTVAELAADSDQSAPQAPPPTRMVFLPGPSGL
jgi:hypothetical protein